MIPVETSSRSGISLTTVISRYTLTGIIFKGGANLYAGTLFIFLGGGGLLISAHQLCTCSYNGTYLVKSIQLNQYDKGRCFHRFAKSR